MTITNENARVIGFGNGVTTVWSFDFLVPTPHYVQVWVCDTTGTLPASSLIDPADYTLSGAGNDGGGTVTYPLSGSPLAVGFNIEIRRAYPYWQITGFNTQGFYPPDVETMGDEIEWAVQQLAAQLQSTLIVPPGSNMTPEEYVIALAGGGSPSPPAGIPTFPSLEWSANEPVDTLHTDYFITAAGPTTHLFPSPATIADRDITVYLTVPGSTTLQGTFNGIANLILGLRWTAVTIHSTGSAYYVKSLGTYDIS